MKILSVLLAITFFSLYYVLPVYPFAVSNRGIDLERGSTQYLNTADAADISVTTAGTFMGWANIETQDSNYMIAHDRYGGGASRGVLVYEDNTGWHCFFSADATGVTTIDISEGADNPLSTWQHIACVYDGVNATLYVNGVQRAQSAYTSGINDSTDELRLGVTNNGGTLSLYFDGIIDDVSIWNRPLSVSEIRKFWNRELLGSEFGLAAYWSLNDESTDRSVSANSTTDNDMTRNNSPVFVAGPPTLGRRVDILFEEDDI